MEYAALVILWVIWCSIHSGMISLTVYGYLKVKSGRYFRFYRLFFNLIALTTLVPLIIYTQSLQGIVIFRWEGYLLFVKYFLMTVSISLFLAGFLKYDMLQFIGVQQIISGKTCSTLSGNGEIVNSGILGVTRHPWYFGSIIFIWSYYEDMYISTLIVNIILTIYLVFGAILEERKLLLEFGDSYRNYQKNVSMFLPLKWIFSKRRKHYGL